MERKRNIATIVVFAVILLGFTVAFFILPDNPRSQAERRLLARPPQLSAENVLGGTFMMDFEEYMQDQFPGRERFRMINALTRRYALRQRDHNGYYYAGGHLSQMEFPLNTQAVEQNAAWLAGLSRHFFEDMNVFYAVVPDKNYFLAEQHGFLALDYEAMMEMIHERLGHLTYIDLFEAMSLDDFYRTDIHWRQEAIFPVAEALARGMGVEIPARARFTEHRLYPFYGSFHGHAALPIAPDELIYLTNEYTEQAVVHILEEINREFVFTRMDGVYRTDLFGGMDSYDVFLAGAQAIVTVEVSNAQSDRELIIFRDSFGSSIAPLLLGGYRKITLVDIRYVPSRMLPELIEFDDQDILFLYNTTLFNRAGLLR